jgi:hypothetical protein
MIIVIVIIIIIILITIIVGIITTFTTTTIMPKPIILTTIITISIYHHHHPHHHHHSHPYHHDDHHPNPQVKDDKFWEEVPELAFGELPELLEDVSVVGYPIGGESLSVTAGVVSRIELQEYAQVRKVFTLFLGVPLR